MEVNIVNGDLVVTDDDGNDITKAMNMSFTQKDMLTLAQMAKAGNTMKHGTVTYGSAFEQDAIALLTFTRKGNTSAINVDQEMVQQLFECCIKVSDDVLWFITDPKDNPFIRSEGVQIDATSGEYNYNGTEIIPTAPYGCGAVVIPWDSLRAILELVKIVMDENSLMLKLGDAESHRDIPEDITVIGKDGQEEIVLESSRLDGSTI